MKNYDVKLWFSKSSLAVVAIKAINIQKAKNLAYRKYAHKNIVKVEVLRELTNKAI
ncbi:MAG: hypothetical protein GX118_07385 [Arcobacter butzleri]|nr:hypothetical protein [Aliarcobacter butzleri]